ncbi:unnamed protein product [Lactuca saligna]|uniref:Uncharacterized protein n=1 Tax=Lactuca saligna TaxID=75948 RepID=A0AA35YPE2_LACSI|nr:unnamed protein product [Lactuca saligna]
MILPLLVVPPPNHSRLKFLRTDSRRRQEPVLRFKFKDLQNCEGEKSIHRLGSETNICTGSFGIVHCADWNGSDVAVIILLEQDFHLENLYEKTRRKVKRQLSPYPFPCLHQIIIIGCNKQLDLKKEDELEKKLKESHISDDKHVIIPNHLHVPEAEKLGFCFGSFDAIFGFNKTPSNSNGLVAVTMSEKTSEASEEADETIEDQTQSRNENADEEEDHLEQPTTSSSNVPKNLPTEGDMSLNAGPECRESKQETSSSSSSSSSSLPTPSHQYPAVHTSPNPNFSFGFMPPMIGSQVTSFENTKSQAHDASHVPSFVVQQPFDLASYYAHFYRRELTNAIHHQSNTNNRHTNRRSHAKHHIRHSTTITCFPFLSNETFPQQPQQGGGGMYPAPPPPVAATSNSKYPLPQYKPGSNTGNIGMAGSYGPYASAAPAGYNQDFLKYNESSLMKLPCKIFDPIPLGEAAVVGRMKDVDSVAMREGSSLYDLVQMRITTTHASVGVVVRLREELSLVKDKPAHFAIDQLPPPPSWSLAAAVALPRPIVAGYLIVEAPPPPILLPNMSWAAE